MTSIYLTKNVPHLGLRLPDRWGDVWQVTACKTSEAADYRGQCWYEMHRLLDPEKNGSPWHNQDAVLHVYRSMLDNWISRGTCNHWSSLYCSLHDIEPCIPVTVEVVDCDQVKKNCYYRPLRDGALEFFLPVQGVWSRTNHPVHPMPFEGAVAHYLECFTGNHNIKCIQSIDYDGYTSRMTCSRGRPWE